MKLSVPNRQGAMPRSALILGALLVVAVAVLVYLRLNPAPPDLTLGGRLFTYPADRIESLLLTRGGAQYRLDRTETGVWTLSGALNDYLDQDAVAQLLQGLASATGGRLLPGTDPEDRRYEFNGPGAIRLTVFGDDGSSEKLAIGAQNPVTGFYYGSGAGRPACFPVASGLRELLTAVPHNLQLKTLLPRTERKEVSRVQIRRGQQSDRLEFLDGRWWLKMPDAGVDALGSWYRDYSVWYADRRQEREGSLWILADDETVGRVIYESSRISVKQILPPTQASRSRDQLGLDPPWRRVVLGGAGINPDPSAGSADELEISFGLAENDQQVPALRRGNVLLASQEAVATISEPISRLVDSRALGFDPALADSLVLEREGEVLLRAHRDLTPAQEGERFKERPVDFWLTDYPAAETPTMNERARLARSRNLLANLDRTPTLQVLPPSGDAAVLQDRERVRLTLWFPAGAATPGLARGRVVLEFGFLDLERLPAGSPPPVFSDDDLDPVGLWIPATGQLLQIPGFTMTTARAWTR